MIAGRAWVACPETRYPSVVDIWRRRCFGAFVVDKNLFGTRITAGTIGLRDELRQTRPSTQKPNQRTTRHIGRFADS